MGMKGGVMESKIFWKDGDYKAKGGYFFRSFDLNKFIEKVESEVGEVVGISFEDSNCELIVREK